MQQRMCATVSGASAGGCRTRSRSRSSRSARPTRSRSCILPFPATGTPRSRSPTMPNATSRISSRPLPALPRSACSANGNIPCASGSIRSGSPHINLSPQDVEAALRRQNVEIPSGRVESQQREFTVLSETDLRTPEQFNDLIIKEANGYPCGIPMSAAPSSGRSTSAWWSRFNGKPAIALGVIKQAIANPLEVAAAGVQKLLPEIRAEAAARHGSEDGERPLHLHRRVDQECLRDDRRGDPSRRADHLSVLALHRGRRWCRSSRSRCR